MIDRARHSVARIFVAAGLLSALGCSARQASNVAAKNGDIPVFPVEKFALPNGLRVVMSVDRSAPVVALNVFYHVGSKNEVAGRSGYAHLFEHLMFEGSQNLPPGRHRGIISEGGGSGGAWTFVDYTEYYNVFPSNLLETMLWRESDRMGFLVPMLNMERINLQREVVNNERRQNYLNRAYGVEPIVAMPQVYPAGHPYSWRTVGYEDDLASVRLEDAKEFFTRYYVPNNAVISIVGDIDPVQTRALVQKYFGDLPRGADIVQPAAPPVTLPTEKRLVLEDPKGQLPQITFLWPTVGVHSDDEAALLALGTLLGAPASDPLAAPPTNPVGARTARLSRVLIYERELATAVEVHQRSDELAGIFLVEIAPRPGVSLTDIETLVDSVISATATSPVSPVELQRLRNFLAVERVTDLQSVMRKSETLALSELFFGDPHRYVADTRRLMSLTPADLQRAAARYLTKGRLVINGVPAGKLELRSRPDAPYTNVTPAAAPATP